MKSKGLSALDESILSSVLERPSITDSELAQIFGVTRQTINKKRNAEAFKEAIKKHHTVQREDLQKVSKIAIAALEELLKAPDGKMRLSAATVVVRYVLAPSVALESGGAASTPEFILEEETV